jgi:hypothetical protein
MPIDIDKMNTVWARYQYKRDNGHNAFVKKADICESFFRGDQWDEADLAALKAQKRPALTINKIISTISNVIGEQIYNRNEISFRPMNGSPEETADALRKTFKQISNNNQLDWKRSDMFTDGIITSRGFLDVRMEFDDSMKGEIRISNLNPKNVLIDPDADEYDPDTWSDVTITKWVTADDIEIYYSKADAELLRNRGNDMDSSYGYDSIEYAKRDRFGNEQRIVSQNGINMSSVLRNIRVIERQHRVISRQKQFVNTSSGDMRPVPEGWDRNRIALALEHMPDMQVISRMAKRIRWTAGADNVLLHDDWSPYDHFTLVPYFPYLRHGKTIGLVENLVGPQELLNKVSSQELHVVNTTANSGWKVKSGALRNMSLEELEQKGSQTGLVLELEELDGAEKITPNATPQGLDRISYKAEEHIKTISNVGDSQQGQDREDVSGKAIQQKRQAASSSQAKPMDSLQRTDFILARNVLALIQTYMSEEQIISITHGGVMAENENTTVNQITPEGTIVNDLTIGEFAVVMTSVPQRDALEDSQFDQAVALKELGINIPDAVLINASRLMDKKDVVTQMQAASNSPEAQAQAQLQIQIQQAELAKTQAETGQKSADTGLKQAKTQSEGVKAQKDAATPIEGPAAVDESAMMKVQAEIALNQQKFEFEKEIKMQEFQLKREEMDMKAELDRKAQADKQVADRIAAAQPKTAPTGN